MGANKVQDMVISDGVNTEKWRFLKPLDLTQYPNMNYEENSDRDAQNQYEATEEDARYGYDSCGAMDLSSNCGSSPKANSDEENESYIDNIENIRKRKSDEIYESIKRKREKRDDDEESEEEEEMEENHQGKVKNKRKKIKDIIEEDKLELSTKAAKAEEEERLKRLRDQKKILMMEAFR